jgi:Fic family protein
VFTGFNMDANDFKSSQSGRVVKTIGGYWAFVPNPLPPKLDWDSSLVSLNSKADIAIGKLSGLGENLVNPDLLIYPFILREAVLSSRIEGTQSSLSDLLMIKSKTVSNKSDAMEVQNYVQALHYGIARLEEIPISLRLIRELHESLMRGVRGDTATPGEFRSTQNWIGSFGNKISEATFVPPPVEEMNKALDQLEKYLHSESDLPLLVQLALIHYQFEAIHPFLDGNGRIGRLLITLFLYAKRVLSYPLLYLSAFFEHNRQEYYDLLLDVSKTGNWGKWIEFFLKGVISQANDHIDRSRLLVNLRESYNRISLEKQMSPIARQLIELIFWRPALNVKTVQERLNVTYPAAQKAIYLLEKEEILIETTGGKRNKAYKAQEVMNILEKDVPPELSEIEKRGLVGLAEAYLDIETTGLSSLDDSIIVLGIYKPVGGRYNVIQLVGENITRENLMKSLNGVDIIYTYNGNRFDLPFIKASLGIDLSTHFRHHDLMYDCWKNNLLGGFRAVERQLQIPRQTEVISGLDAIRLWGKYQASHEEDALNLLLQNNKEDVMNLKILKEKLPEYQTNNYKTA